MSVYDEPKIDCHIHVFDPLRFPYAADATYLPAGQERATVAQFETVLGAYGVGHALIVGPNSGYGTDNRCLLDAIARGQGRHKGVAVVANDIGEAELQELKSQGVVGVTMNATYFGADYYAHAEPLLAKLAALGMFVQVQVERDQMARLAPMLLASGANIVVDHCGRPNPEQGLGQDGFKSVLELAGSGRASVKLSGYAKFSRQPWPHDDTHPYIRALVEAFTPDACMWGSDWPFLRATERVDYGPLLKLVEALFLDRARRQKIFWDTPRRLFGFGDPADQPMPRR